MPNRFVNLACAVLGSAAVTLLVVPALAAQESRPATRTYAHATDAPSVQITRTTASIRIDGVLDETAWAEAQPITSFTQIEPDEGQQPRQRTEFRLLLADDAIYVAARMYETDPSRIRARLARRDESVDGDVMGVYFDSRHDHISAYYFRVSAGGAMRDAIVNERGNLDLSWDAVWQAAVSQDSLGWTAEVRIPLSQIPYAQHGDGVWGLQLDRYRWNDQERSVFAFSPRAEVQGPPRFGHLRGMTDLPAPQRLELLPYVSARSEHLAVGDGNPFRSGSDQFANVGLDLRYRLTSGLNLNATVNPDFGQVEVDPAVVNLSAFETFFPERRPFFVEGRQLFNFGTWRSYNSFGTPTMFFSRRVGRPPQRQLFGPAHVEAPEATTIAGAAKVTGQLGGGWSVALLDAVTTRENARFVGAGDAIERAEVEPFTNYFVGRVRREMSQGNTQIGAFASSVNRDVGDEVLEGMLRSAAYAGGIDFNHSWDSRRWGLDGMLSFTQVRGSETAIASTQRASSRYFQRPDAGHLDYDPARTTLGGHYGHISLARTAGTNWIGSLTFQEMSPGFEVNDIGFMTQVDRRGISPLVGLRETQPQWIFRNYFVGGFSNHAWNFGGDLVNASYGMLVEAQLRNFWFINLRGDYNESSFDDRLTRGGPMARTPKGHGGSININSDPRNPWQAGLFMGHNRNAEGLRTNEVGFNIGYQPSPSVRLTLEPNYFGTTVPAQYITRADDASALGTYGARYVFATLDQEQLSLVTRVDWTFSPRLSLQVFVQPLVSAGEFSEFKQLREAGTYRFDTFGRDVGTVSLEDGIYTISPTGDPDGPQIQFGNPDFNFRSLRGNAVLRWEYRPGSTLFFVWQQRRVGSEPFGDFDFSRDYGAIFSARPENVFAVKATYWITR